MDLAAWIATVRYSVVRRFADCPYSFRSEEFEVETDGRI